MMSQSCLLFNTHYTLAVSGTQITYMVLIVWESEVIYIRISIWIKIVEDMWGLTGSLRTFPNNPCLVLVLILSTSFHLHKMPLEEVLQLLIGIWLLLAD